MNDYIKKLKEEYTSIFESDRNSPDWGVKKKTKEENIHPAIPFVGESYEMTRLLLYASAENLTYYEKKIDEYSLEDDSVAINRRQVSKSSYFPKVHIAPVNDGSLLIVAAYILNKLNIKLNYSLPYEFIENIAVDNFCKFSIKSQDGRIKNKDYVKYKDKIKYSFQYIKSDLEILKPKILILPKSIYNHIEVQEIIKSTLPECLVLPIYQINARNINLIIAKKHLKKKQDEIQEILIDWQKELSNGIVGKTNDNFYSVYSYLDEIPEQKEKYNT